MTRSSQQDDPYAGQYAGSAIVFPRRRTAEQPGQPTRKRSARQPEPNHQQGSTFGIHPADDPYETDSFPESSGGWTAPRWRSGCAWHSS